MRQKFAVGLVVLAAVALVAGASMLALASPGTPSDPVITLGYLTDVFRPQVMAEVRVIEQAATQAFNTRISQIVAQIGTGQGGTASAPEPAGFRVVTLSRGQTLVCEVGVELMLRIGTATVTGATPGLINYTTGAALAAGSSLTTNHMYLVTIENNGLRATADTVRVLVRGTYRIT